MIIVNWPGNQNGKLISTLRENCRRTASSKETGAPKALLVLWAIRGASLGEPGPLYRKLGEFLSDRAVVETGIHLNSGTECLALSFPVSMLLSFRDECNLNYEFRD